MGKHFTAEFKLEAAKLVVDHGYTYVKAADSALTVKALQMTWELRGQPTGVMFHSDQGSHYTSRQYWQALWRCRSRV